MPTDPSSIPDDVLDAACDGWDHAYADRRNDDDPPVPEWTDQWRDDMRQAVAAALDALIDDAAMDRLIEEIIVSLGGERGVTDDRFPLARWDMAHIVRKAVFHAH